ncbi:MAG TPA: DUF6249 domain-containing protein [Chthoniobacterales bacterium]|jgi:hypothetical protein
MKILFLACAGSLLLVSGAFSQTPASPAPASPAGSVAVAPAASISPARESSDLADKIHKRIDQRLKQKGVHFSIGDDEDIVSTAGSHNDVPEAVIPLVAIIFMTVFGAPVLIVAVIMYFGFSRNRMMHRTIRQMVEKGQPVPTALLAPPPPAQKQRSDMRRGVVLMMVGIGLMVFFAAVNDWEGGAWAIGIIPFLIGAGYLLVWKLEGGTKPKTDNPPPLP